MMQKLRNLIETFDRILSNHINQDEVVHTFYESGQDLFIPTNSEREF